MTALGAALCFSMPPLLGAANGGWSCILGVLSLASAVCKLMQRYGSLLALCPGKAACIEWQAAARAGLAFFVLTIDLHPCQACSGGYSLQEPHIILNVAMLQQVLDSDCSHVAGRAAPGC
jgi:hypothetical protein